MPAEQKNIGGKLNTDTSPYKVPTQDYIDALNITRDSQSELKDDVVSNIVGNTFQSNFTTPGINTSKCIGSKADPVRNRIYYFGWNSGGYHFIVYWDKTTGTTVKLIANLTDTNNVDVLKFNPSYRINHIDIIYRDDDGDLLFWTDGINPPRKINVLTAVNGGYGNPIVESYIDVAKEPPSSPPMVVYQNDITITVNNLHKKLFVFKTRFIFDDLEKSVPSSQSVMPLPILSFNSDVDQDPTKNNNIFIVFETGRINVKKIEIWGSESIGNEFGQFFLIDTLIKSDLNIPNDDLYYYIFYNNQSYNFVDPTDASQIYDYVPQSTNSQALLNGNVLAYGGITENYDLLPATDGISLTLSTSIPSDFYQKTELLIARNVKTVTSGLTYIRLYSGGTGSTGDTYTVAFQFTNTSGSTSIQVISYTILNGDSPIVAISYLAIQAVSFGFTIVETNVPVYPNSTDKGYGSILLSIGTTLENISVLWYNISVAPNDNIGNNSVGCYDWNSNYGFGNVYFDEKGRTNSVITNINGVVTTGNYGEMGGRPTLPLIELGINYRPPIWAKYYQVVRTNNLSKSYSEYWISDRTFMDNIINDQGYQYAYVSIANLNQFIVDNPSTGSQLAYGFSVGDRIRFVKIFNTDGSTKQIFTTADFEIQQSLLNPIINGIQETGQILKLILPSDSSGVFFGDNFPNYLINIYTPNVSASDKLNFYYEFGKEYYQIGNAGTDQAYHYGVVQNQSPDLITPANIILSNNGDAYYRTRYIPVGNELKYTMGNTAINGGSVNTIPLVLTSETFNSENYAPNSFNSNVPVTAQSTILQIVSPPPYSVNFKVEGFITITVNSIGAGYTGWDLGFYFFATTGAGYSKVTNILNDTRQLSIGATYTYQILQNITMRQLDLALLAIGAGMAAGTQFTITLGDLVFTEINNIAAQGIIDYNFSDYYPSKVNSNGRAFIVDPNAKQQYNPVLIRNGGTFEFGTSINNINRFYGITFDQYDRSLGDIQKLFVEGRVLWVFQKFDTGNVPIFQQVVQNTSGDPLDTESTAIINKIQYPFKGKYGIGDLPESFAYYNYAKYFIDNNKNVVIRISQDGITVISELYKMNAYFTQKLKAYQKTLNNGYPNRFPFGPSFYFGNPTVYGCFDYFTNKYIIALESIDRYDINGNLIFHQDASTVVFNEVRDSKEGFESFVSYLPENMVSLGTLLCSFQNSQLWSHDNTAQPANFYGVPYFSSITLVFNKDVNIKKTFLAIGYKGDGNALWGSPNSGDINTSFVNPQTLLQQISSLIVSDYKLDGSEGTYVASFLRDANSGTNPIIATLEGDYLKGNWIAIKFTYKGSSSTSLIDPYITYGISGRNY